VGIATNMDMGGSLARPTGNLTGIALLFDEVATKWLELLIEAVPSAQRIGVLFEPSPSNAQQFQAVRTTAAKLGKALRRCGSTT
jgi:putative ABC transport system substrate-binding protein